MQKRVLLTIALLCGIAMSASLSERKADPNWLGTADLIKQQKYPVETHTVHTADGYILTLHRIPNPTRPVVLMVHGLMTNSACWAGNLPNNTLSYMLFDAGFDIWLINFRGTIYSKEHETLDPDSREYWQFSWTEEGLHDLPSTIDFIQEKTGHSNVSIAVHSEGAAATMAMLSLKPDYACHIPFVMAFSPAVFIKHTSCPGVHTLSHIKALSVLDVLGINHINVLPLKHYLPEWFCREAPFICELTMSEMMGWDLSNLYPPRMQVYVDMLDESSLRNLQHGFQCMDTGMFRQYDYGSDVLNQEKYGENTPPLFPIQDITVPMALYYGGNDKMVVPEDVETMLLPAITRVQMVQTPVLVDHWSHVGPVLGWEATELSNAVELCRKWCK